MKHLVIFLNYTASRIDHPVYRLFATESLMKRNFSLLFLPKPLEERDLLHEVEELRRRHTDGDDVTFHICVDMRVEGQGEALVGTSHLVRRLFAPTDSHQHTVFAYCLMPQADATPSYVKTAWDNLATINNAVADYAHQTFIRSVFLYEDASQQSLARYLFYTTRVDLGTDYLLTPSHPDERAATTPPIFASFNATGITYPEEQIQTYLHQCYLLATIRTGLASDESIPMQQCQAEAERIVSSLPLQNEIICQQQSGQPYNAPWAAGDSTQQSSIDYWRENIPLDQQDMKEIPHGDWLLKTHQRADVLYQGKFRGMGVELFYATQMRRTEQYVTSLLSVVQSQIETTIRATPHAPQSIKYLILAVTNLLQQKVADLQSRSDLTASQVTTLHRRVATLEDQWRGLGLLGRMRGRDKELLSTYNEALTELEVAQTWLPSYAFAIKLLNELIPCISALTERYEHLRHCMSDAIREVEQTVIANDPRDVIGIFDYAEVAQARAAIDNDVSQLRQEYLFIVNRYLDTVSTTEVTSLLPIVRSSLLTSANLYIEQQIASGQMPRVLRQSIVERIDAMRRDDGGIYYFVQSMKPQVSINLRLKEQAKPSTEGDNMIVDEYLLIAPTHVDNLKIDQVATPDNSTLQLIHVLRGVTLADLDGFTGQRMFIEPSIF